MVVPHIFVIRVDSVKRDSIREKLSILNIPTGIHYKPNHLLSLYRLNQVDSTLVRTEEIYKRLITLPLHPDLSVEQVIYVCKKLKSLL